MSAGTDELSGVRLLRRGRQLEAATLGWNLLGLLVLAVAALDAHSVALGGFGLDSLIEIGASVVVLWELADADNRRQQAALRMIQVAFVALGTYLLGQAFVLLVVGYHPRHSDLGMAWTAVTAAVMFTLAAGKSRVGRQLKNRVLIAEGRVTVVDGLLACAVLAGLVLSVALGWWWADPCAALAIVYYAVREVFAIHGELPGSTHDRAAAQFGPTRASLPKV